MQLQVQLQKLAGIIYLEANNNKELLPKIFRGFEVRRMVPLIF